MNQPTPAIVAQAAVVRLPRLALWFFCTAYLLPGFLGRVPWKRADITAFGFMAELAAGTSNWMHPTIGGLPAEIDALLPYWLGAWAIQLGSPWIASDFAARIPFMIMLGVTMVAIWYATYDLARSPLAQPLAFAFGGEARPTDYARAIADGGLLAFTACLGLAQLAHETTPALAQLCFTALLLYAGAALPYAWKMPSITALIGILGLALSGAPSVAVLLGSGCAAIYFLDNRLLESAQIPPKKSGAIGFLGLTIVTALLASALDLWRWRIDLPNATWSDWQSMGRLFLWFTWPCWPLAIWTLWRWRRQLFGSQHSSRHLWLPIWFTVVASLSTLTTSSAERSLLLALPTLAILSAFALPTLGRNLGALIDWFTLIFFSGCALTIWIVWVSMQTGIPAQPGHNVARLAPGFVHSFSYLSFLAAVCATLAWVWLVKWRVGRHQSALWKSVVLPAGGASLCWLLLMTLWLPLLDFARSYAPLVEQAIKVMPAKPSCLATLGLSRSQMAAFQFHGNLTLKPLNSATLCPWLIVDDETLKAQPKLLAGSSWLEHSSIRHPSDPNETLRLYTHQPQ